VALPPKTQPAGIWVRSTLLTLATEAEVALAASVSGHDPEGLHQLRIILRRARLVTRWARAWCPETAPWSREALRRTLRRTRRLRDLDVLAQRLGGPGASARVMQPVDAERARERQAVQAWLTYQGPPLVAALRSLAADEDLKASQPLWLAWRDTMTLRARRKVGKRWRRAARAISANRRHRLRIAVRDYKYTLQLLHGPDHPHLAAVRRAQDILGDLQDIRVGRKLLKEFNVKGGPRSAAGRAMAFQKEAQHKAATRADRLLAGPSFESRPDEQGRPGLLAA
jgi:CHAD domain-containing protein